MRKTWETLMAVLMAAGMTVCAWSAEPTITVTARQRHPWNGLVGVAFTITGDAGSKYDTSFTAKDVAGGTNLTLKTLCKSSGAAADPAKETLLPGSYSWVWDAQADLGVDADLPQVKIEVTTTLSAFPYSVKFNANGGTGTMANESFTYSTAKALTANPFTRTGYTFQGWATSADGAVVYADNQSVSNLTATSGGTVNLYAVWKQTNPLYMVIDLSAGANATSYPVTYLDAEPSGGFNVNAYKTTKLVLKRIEPWAFIMGWESVQSHKVTLTKKFYMGAI